MEILYENIKTITSKNFNNLLKLIKENKRVKISKIKHVDSKKRSLLGECLLIKLLSCQKINYDDLIIYTNKFGKPYIKNYDLFYNISHSHDYSVCGISNKEIGLDIEKIRIVNENIINQFATPNEIKYINNNIKEKYLKIFEIYTLKEAYFKCLGSNLSNIKNVEFSINKNVISCSDNKVSIQLLYDLKDYVIAVCEMKND